VTKRGKREAKGTWWNENVKKAIKEKKDCFRHIHLDRSADNVEQYKVAKKIAKRVVSERMSQMYDGLYLSYIVPGIVGTRNRIEE
jgi:hypothetical protein